MSNKEIKENPDLTNERKNSTINVKKLINFIAEKNYGSIERYEHLRRLSDELKRQIRPLMDENYDNLDRNEKYELVMKKSLEMFDFKKKHQIELIKEYYFVIGSVVGFEKQALGLHLSMFSTSLDLWSTPEQRAYWKTFMDNNFVLGTYIQTELGHGTFVRGLETTATYDKATQEFVINSPTLTSTKFWPGSLGKTSNYGVLMAKLIIDGKDHGIQSFIVPLRSFVNHEPLPGIEIGDIGRKYGYDPVDNGFVRFNNVRIPRLNMLMRYSEVSPSGEFRKLGNQRVMYACMLLTRGSLCNVASNLLSISTTIAVRYSVVRRQTANANGIESQIIDYQTQQNRLLPSLASSYVFILSSLKFQSILSLFQNETDNFKNISSEDLAKLHVVSSGIKALIFDESLKYAQQNRLCCGGHGYSMSSGLNQVIQELDAGCTYEGDNIVLYLQIARYLLKCAQNGANPHLNIPDLQKIQSSSFFRPFQVYFDFYNQLYNKVSAEASDRMLYLIGEKKLTQFDAWNQSSVLFVYAAKCYTNLFIINSCLSSIYSHLTYNCAQNQQALERLFELYLLNGIVNINSSCFLKMEILNTEQMNDLQAKYFQLLNFIRPDALCLVDSFDWGDNYLGSTIGAYDGNVYERLFEFAKNSKLNQKEVHDVYEKYAKPYILKCQSKL